MAKSFTDQFLPQEIFDSWYGQKDTFYLKVTGTESTDKSQNKRNNEIFKLMLANLTCGRTAQCSSR